MKLEPIKAADLSGLCALASEAWDLDPYFASCLQEKWERGQASDGIQILARAKTDEILGFAMASNRGSLGFLTALAVSKPWRRRGIASLLLAHCEKLLQERAVTQIRLGEAAPNYFWPGLDPRYTAAMSLFEARNYRHFSVCHNMEVELKDLNAFRCEISQTGLRIARAQAPDRYPVLALIQQHWPSWLEELELAFRLQSASVQVAWREEQPVAFAVQGANNWNAPWFGPMGTAPEAQGKGLGKALLLASLADIKERGFQKAIIPWVGPYAFYSKCVNARISATYFRYQREL